MNTIKRVTLAVVEKSWIRLLLAALVIVAGLAPVGASALGDDTLRPAPAGADLTPARQAMRYRVDVVGTLERSADNGATWTQVPAFPEKITAVATAGASNGMVVVLGQSTIWRSTDAGLTWVRAAKLPSRPTGIAASGRTNNTLFVATESLGLYRSVDGGGTWQPVELPMAEQAGGRLGVTAVAANPEDDQIIYVAVGYWLGTSEAHYTPMGTYLSVDGGRRWAPIATAPLGAHMVIGLEPVAGRPLAVTEVTAAGKQTVELTLDATVLAGLDDADAATRAATARIVGLSGEREMMPALLRKLQDADQFAGDQAAEALGRLQDGRAVPSLLAMLDSADEMVRARSALALGALKVDAAVPALSGMLLNDGSLARRRAAEALARIGSPAAVDALMAPMADDELTPRRHAAMQGLELLGSPAVGPLTAALESSDAALRRNAAEMLGWLQSPVAVDGLAGRLSDPELAVRQQAAWALGEIGNGPARDALSAAMAREKDVALRSEMEMAVSRMASADTETVSGGSSSLAALLAVLGQIPPSRWTILAVALMLAAMLILSTRRPVHAAR